MTVHSLVWTWQEHGVCFSCTVAPLLRGFHAVLSKITELVITAFSKWVVVRCAVTAGCADVTVDYKVLRLSMYSCAVGNDLTQQIERSFAFFLWNFNKKCVGIDELIANAHRHFSWVLVAWFNRTMFIIYATWFQLLQDWFVFTLCGYIVRRLIMRSQDDKWTGTWIWPRCSSESVWEKRYGVLECREKK